MAIFNLLRSWDAEPSEKLAQSLRSWDAEPSTPPPGVVHFDRAGGLAPFAPSSRPPEAAGFAASPIELPWYMDVNERRAVAKPCDARSRQFRRWPCACFHIEKSSTDGRSFINCGRSCVTSIQWRDIGPTSCDRPSISAQPAIDGHPDPSGHQNGAFTRAPLGNVLESAAD